MKTLKEYLTAKRIHRMIERTFDGLAVIYRFMSFEEKELLKSHRTSMAFNADMRDCYPIKSKYCLSWNEVKYLVEHFC